MYGNIFRDHDGGAVCSGTASAGGTCLAGTLSEGLVRSSRELVWNDISGHKFTSRNILRGTRQKQQIAGLV